MPIPNSPLLRAKPETLPPWRKGTEGEKGGFLKYIAAVQPGPPPFGWKDVTPYFGKKYTSLDTYKKRAAENGYILERQIVTQKGRTYRRIAVALLSHHTATK